MNCKLCLENNDLQNSHIIPDAFFRSLKDKKNNVGKYTEISKEGNKLAQESYSEYMLCSACEKKFSIEFESYVIELILRNPHNVGVKSERSNNEVRFENIDYKQLKLFQMSILWRAAVSTHDFYKHVKLSPKLLELLRNNLEQLTPLEPHILPCFMDRLFIDIPNNKAAKKDLKESEIVIFKPKKTTLEAASIEFITFVFGGFVWRFWPNMCSSFHVDTNKVANNKGILICPIKSINSNELLLQAGVLAKKNEVTGKGFK